VFDGILAYTRQRQRDPVDASAEILDVGLDPGIPVRRGLAHRVADPFFPSGPQIFGERALSFG
jgi:hypothetical protein